MGDRDGGTGNCPDLAGISCVETFRYHAIACDRVGPPLLSRAYAVPLPVWPIGQAHRRIVGNNATPGGDEQPPGKQPCGKKGSPRQAFAPFPRMAFVKSESRRANPKSGIARYNARTWAVRDYQFVTYRSQRQNLSGPRTRTGSPAPLPTLTRTSAQRFHGHHRFIFTTVFLHSKDLGHARSALDRSAPTLPDRYRKLSLAG